MTDHDAWPDGRIQDRFSAVDAHLHDLREQIRVFAPIVKTTAALEEAVDNLEEDVKELKVDVKEIVNRSVTLRIAIVLAPIILTCLGIAIAVITGKIG